MEKQLFFSHTLNEIGTGEHARSLAHAFCTAGSCTFLFNGMEHTMQKGDLLIVRKSNKVELVQPSANFAVSVIYATPEFIALSSPPQSNYGSKGQVALYLDPVMHLTEEMQRTCQQDFDLVEQRLRRSESQFYHQMLMAAMQLTILDFFDFHAELYKEDDVSTQNASIMFRFIELLEAGEIFKSREVAHYADRLFITAKYLSEVTNKVSGHSANYWIDRYTMAEINRLLRDKSLTFVEISDRLQFSSPAYFSRYVQQHFGMSPSAFRGDK